MNRMLVLLAGTMLSTQALALDACEPSKEDVQTRICTYNPNQRYVVNGLVGFPVNLQFGDSERIKRNAPAYTAVDEKGKPAKAWSAASNKAEDAAPIDKDRFKTNLPIWPFLTGRSSLVVITQLSDGSERPYSFDLNARMAAPGCNVSESDPGCPKDTITTRSLSFVYPADKAREEAAAKAEKQKIAVTAWQDQQAKKKEAIGIARLKTESFNCYKNVEYQAVAELKYAFLAPKTVCDNGMETVMQWPGNIQVPTILVIDPVTGDPRVATVSKQGDRHVINTTSEWFRLSLGHDAVMDIHNLKWNAERPDPGTGTTSPDVVRTVTYRDGK